MSVRASASVAFELLRRHVERAEMVPVPGQRHVQAWFVWTACAAGPLPLGETEVEQLGAALGQHDVRGLRSRCTMPARARLSSASADLERPPTASSDGQRAPRGAAPERLALDVLHDEEGAPRAPTSWSVQMCGWFSPAMACASRSKRCFSGSPAKCGGRTLIATSRSRRVSVGLDLAHPTLTHRTHDLVVTPAFRRLQSGMRAGSHHRARRADRN